MYKFLQEIFKVLEPVPVSDVMINFSGKLIVVKTLLHKNNKGNFLVLKGGIYGGIIDRYFVDKNNDVEIKGIESDRLWERMQKLSINIRPMNIFLGKIVDDLVGER